MLLIFALSILVTERAGTTPAERNYVFGRLSRERSFGQTFAASPGNLVGVRVLLFANTNAREDPVTLRLGYAEGNLPELAIVVLPLHALDRRTWSTFDIPPLALNLTTTLRLDIEARTLPPSDWITVMAGPNTYPDGLLFIDDMPHPAIDLAFQPVYQNRPLDDLLPITRMALGKPGLLGWPPLYALLAYCSTMVSAHVFLALWQAVRSTIDAR
jgi:hypothetical protein